jgi:2-amino-4-hydroxy-6-hydroxymethyldihydropteridine diphosphokinase
VYETQPVGEVPDQRDFFNAVVEVGTDLPPLELLAACKDVERELGRTPGPRRGPRPIDVDVLMLGDLTLATDRLTLPHPEVRRRRFVLVPLLEVDPALRLPDGTGLRECLESLPAGQRVTRVAAF